MKQIFKTLFLTIATIALFAVSASASTLCSPLGTYQLASTCNPASFKIYGDGGTNQSLGTTQGLITGNSFQVGFDNRSSASDVLILAIFSSDTVAGTLNGISFFSLLANPFNPTPNAITNTLGGLNFPTGPLAFGWVDLSHGLASGEKLTVNMSGVPTGTIFFAESVNPFSVVLSTTTVCDKYKDGKCTKSHTVEITGTSNQIDHINSYSEAGITQFKAPVFPTETPEPATLVLLGSGLAGLALLRRRR